ncbi:MAG TPA: exo-alpha-sialidase [Rhizobiaceae bacterium]|nr:exo-alpha-sialidase [Rhizobiaceae bacterium]
MPKKVLLLIGTKKGAFIAESDKARRKWTLRGPFCETWPINHIVGDPETGAIYAGGGNEWFGAAVWKSTDLGKTWTHSSKGLNYEAGEDPVKAVWSIAPKNGSVYAGVQPAGLFRSKDGGKSWRHVEGLRKHPTKPEWQPGAGGLILHSLVPHPDDDKKMWIGISAAGVFYTKDGGKTWETRNKGTRADFLPEGQNYPEFGQCVHCVVMAPGEPDLLYQQNHCGMYRTEDGAKTWKSIENGLPSSFGFPAAAHPRDPDTVYLLPLNGDSAGRYVPKGKAAVYRSRDRGEHWDKLTKGLPQQNAYFGVLRQALATDSLDPAGVYFGTNGGVLFGSRDEGDSWEPIAEHLPVISSVETLVVDR